MPLSVNTRDSYINTLADSGPVHPDIERPFEPTVPSLFGMVARAYINEFGADERDLGTVARMIVPPPSRIRIHTCARRWILRPIAPAT
jgi:hypothetical protein